jgi:hypothetical protein
MLGIAVMEIIWEVGVNTYVYFKYSFLSESLFAEPGGREHSIDLNADGKVILKWILGE